MVHGALYLRNAPVRRKDTFNLVDHGNIRGSLPRKWEVVLLERTSVNHFDNIFVHIASFWHGTGSPASIACHHVGRILPTLLLPSSPVRRVEGMVDTKGVAASASWTRPSRTVLARAPLEQNEASCLVVEGWQGGRRENLSVTASRLWRAMRIARSSQCAPLKKT